MNRISIYYYFIFNNCIKIAIIKYKMNNMLIFALYLQANNQKK
jgi:hypothetical protein